MRLHTLIDEKTGMEDKCSILSCYDGSNGCDKERLRGTAGLREKEQSKNYLRLGDPGREIRNVAWERYTLKIAALFGRFRNIC